MTLLVAKLRKSGKAPLWGRASEEDREGEIERNYVKVIRALGTNQWNGPEPQRNYTTISQLDTHTQTHVGLG